MWQSLYPVYKKIQEAGGFPFHCGFVELNGQGCLLAAPGNTGKSTCCSRIPPPWRAVSDDEAVIVKLKEGKYVVHPMPTWSNFLWRDREGTAGWAGNTKPPATRFTWRAEESIPLKAVFFLEQAPEDSLEVVSQGQAAVYMNDSASQVCRRSWRKLDPEIERGYKRRVFQNACELSKSVPSFLLKVSLTGRFWEKMEEALNS
jgi:SynChlorMet cassette protein ScmC